MSNRIRDIDRRTFLGRLTAVAGLLAACPATALAAMREAARRAPDIGGRVAADPWKTLDAVQQHLFPAGDDIPGATDIGALRYLHDAIENPDADGEDRAFIFKGVGWLNDLTQTDYRQPFVALDEAQRETVLRKIERSRAGRNWLSLLLTYLLEALLADPVYGGNPDGIGWEWLEHQPGYPTPPPDRVWYRLGERVTFRRKAT